MQVDYLVTVNNDHKPNSFITREAPVETCNYKKVHLPTQELLHRKKCLLPDSKPESVGMKCLNDDNILMYSPFVVRV